MGLARIRHSRLPGRIGRAVVALYALRALVPVGYMPASIGDGGPFVLCADQSAATLTLLESQFGGMAHSPGAFDHHSNPDDSPSGSHDNDSWERCFFAPGSQHADVAPNDPASPAATPLLVERSFTEPQGAGLRALYRARAPPA
jgi:hypothetical protein